MTNKEAQEFKKAMMKAKHFDDDADVVPINSAILLADLLVKKALNSQLEELEGKVERLDYTTYSLKHQHGAEDIRHKVLALIREMKK